MPATNEEFIKKAFESGLTERQVRSAVAERNQRLGSKPKDEGLLGKIKSFSDNVAQPTMEFVSAPFFNIFKGGIQAAPEAAKSVVDLANTGAGLATGNLQADANGQIRGRNGEVPQQFSDQEKFNQGNRDLLRGNAQLAQAASTVVGLNGIPGINPAGYINTAVQGGTVGALSEPARNNENVDLGQMGKDAATSTALSILTKLGFDTGGKIKGAVANTSKSSSDQLLQKASKITPGEAQKFKEKTGTSVQDFMRENNMYTDFGKKTAQKLDDLQTQFDDLAIKSGVEVPSNELNKAFLERIDDYNDSVIPSIKAKAEDLKSIQENLIKKYGSKINVADLTKERKAIDAVLKESQFGMPMEQASYLRSARNALQESIQNATDKVLTPGQVGLKQLGKDLGKYIQFNKLAEKSVTRGANSSPIGLIQTVMSGAGGTVAGIPGAFAGLAIGAVQKDPTALGYGAKAIDKLSNRNPSNLDLSPLTELLQRGVTVAPSAIKQSNESGQINQSKINTGPAKDRFEALRRLKDAEDRKKQQRVVLPQ